MIDSTNNDTPFTANEVEGKRAELLSLVQQLRTFTVCVFANGERFYFANGCLLGDPLVEQRLLDSLGTSARARVLSSHRVEHILDGAASVTSLLLRAAKAIDEQARTT